MELIITINSNTESLLNQWGKWSRMGLGLGLGTPSNDNFHVIHDELALIVDAVVCRLGKGQPKKMRAIELHYQQDYTPAMIGKHLNCGETKARDMLKQGVAWVDGYLDSYRMELDDAA